MTNETPKQAANRFVAKLLTKGFIKQALHEYQTPEGQILYWRIRLKHVEKNEKWIRPMHRNAQGEFVLGEPVFSNKKLLYRLPDILKSKSENKIIWIVEGEYCADKLTTLGLVATTSGGVESTSNVDWTPLADREVIIWPDKDEAGLRYAEQVKLELQKINCEIYLIDVEKLNLPTKGDCVDWLKIHVGATVKDINALPVISPSPENPSIISDEQDDEALRCAINELAALPLLMYEKIRKDKAIELGMRAAVLDKLVQTVRAHSEKAPQIVIEAEPWHLPVDAAEVLSELSEAFRKYAILPTYADIALALWCAYTWFCDYVYIAPLLVIRSPEKGCGKSTVMNIIARLVCRPLLMSGTSAAVLYRVVDKYKPTVLIDEGDTFLNKENEELHGIINSGYSKTAPYHWRCVGEHSEPKAFNVFSPKAIALIGHTKDTLHDRAIEVELRRKMPTEKVARLRHADGRELNILARKLARLSVDYRDGYIAASPAIPETFPDRQADNWEPLIAVAMLAGDEWTKKALEAALTFTERKVASSVLSVGVELLADIQTIFEIKNSNRISTIDLIESLCKDEEAAWSTYNRGKAITPRQISKRLAEYGVKPKTIRFDFKLQKGYEKNQFEDAFVRYVLPPILSVTTLQTNEIKGLAVTDEKLVTVTKPLSATNHPVTDKLPAHVEII